MSGGAVSNGEAAGQVLLTVSGRRYGRDPGRVRATAAAVLPVVRAPININPGRPQASPAPLYWRERVAVQACHNP